MADRVGNTEAIEVTLRQQEKAAVGRIIIRRFIGFKRVPVWRDELLGDSPSTQPAAPPS